MTAVFLQQLINGVTIGAVYALIAVGLTLVFGILDVINFAHGEFYMLGAFITYSLTTAFGLDYFAALGLAVAGAALAGLLAERLTVRPLQGRPMFTVVLSTLGLSIFLQNAALLFWGPSPREIDLAWGSRPVVVGPVVVSLLRLIALLTGAALIAGLTWFIRRNRWGSPCGRWPGTGTRRRWWGCRSAGCTPSPSPWVPGSPAWRAASSARCSPSSPAWASGRWSRPSAW